LTDFSSDEKFVKELAEAMPPGRAAVFVLLAKRPKSANLDGFRAGEGGFF
jgi:uncharacterized membrane protein